MNDQLKDAAAQVILAALHSAESTGAWLKGQIPDVLHQLIAYNLVIDSVWLGLSIAVIVAGLWASIKYRRWIVKDAEGFPYVAWSLVIFPVIGICICGPDLLEILIAPKVWILEYARHLL